MAVKKAELYSSLWASCDALRGGMDASQYKDYVLTLLFMKYVTDKYKGKVYAEIKVFDKEHDPEKDPEKRTGCSFDDFVSLRGNKNIGEGMDKVIARLAEVNTTLKGVIDNAHFNDEAKLGTGKEMVDKLDKLIGIFQRPQLDFSKNRAEGDDIIGDAYEYLMKNFATQSGKSKGQFYTPAEVSRILAKVIGIGNCTDSAASICDPACGSGSLLIRALSEAPFDINGFGQEKDVATAGLAKMNAVLHNKPLIVIKAGNTFSNPQYTVDDTELQRFDYAVANPPFSMKNWTDGISGKEFGRFDGYGDQPPEKNGDFAWLMHILKIIKQDKGKAAVILPHGVLFRGNAEGTIRQSIIDHGWIKGIISLPANLFYGTSIPACILVLDKEDAAERQDIFMIDASHDFIKDGDKNRLRERDIYKIVTTFNQRITDDPRYARSVPMAEIKEKNEYNLNISRYIDSSEPEDLQSIEAHLHGGIPQADVDSLGKYWLTFTGLCDTLFEEVRPGYQQLKMPVEEVRTGIDANAAYQDYGRKIKTAFVDWRSQADMQLYHLTKDTRAKTLIRELAEDLLRHYESLTLLDKYDVYEVLLAYWNETMADDVALVISDGYLVGREWENIMELQKSGKNKGKEKVVGWDGKLIPKAVMIDIFYPADKVAVQEAENQVNEAVSAMDEFVEENSDEDSVLVECQNEKGTITDKAINDKIKELKGNPVLKEDYAILRKYSQLAKTVKSARALLKKRSKALDEKCQVRYPQLTEKEIQQLLIEYKWYATMERGITELYTAISHHLSTRIIELAERYAETLPELTTKVAEDEAKVRCHLERMGFAW